MRLLLSLPVLVVVLSIVLEGPASTQATPDLSKTIVQDLEKVSTGLDSSMKEFGRSVTDKLNELGGKLKEFGRTLEEKATNFKNSISSKLRDWFG